MVTMDWGMDFREAEYFKLCEVIHNIDLEGWLEANCLKSSYFDKGQYLHKGRENVLGASHY